MDDPLTTFLAGLFLGLIFWDVWSFILGFKMMWRSLKKQNRAWKKVKYKKLKGE